MKREPSTKSEKKTAEVDGQNRLYEILERELQAKNERIAALQAELSKERQHSREQAERIAVLADQAQRLPFIDLIRGITIIEMISYHFLWDLVYLYNADIPWYKSHGAYIWQQSICWTFILLAGFSWHLGKKHMKRGLWAFGGGVVVSLVTAIVLPNDRVRYGVLTLIGSCILIWILLDKVLKKIPAGVGVSVSFVLFLILRSWTKQDPIQLSDNLLNVTWWKSVLAYIGFPQAGFSSTDYFPLLPWIFLFATGYFLYSFLQEKGMINRLFGKWKVPGINFLGKHSLIIYMIHQPICYVVAFLVSEIF